MGGAIINSNGKCLRKIMIVLLVGSMIMDHGVAEKGRRVPREKYLKFKKHLEFLNRPAVKSFQNQHGNIIDCIDIYKQPAFDHPLLKNSTIQMRPSALPEGMNIETSLGTTPFEKYNQSCPPETIPIRRTQMEDLLRFDSPFDFGKKLGPDDPQYNHDEAILMMKKKSSPIYGAHGRLNVWQPEISNEFGHRYSLSEMKFYKGPSYYLNTIETGWLVYPQLFDDSYPHLFVYWTADGYVSTGCFNLACPGFVQVSNEIAVGVGLQPVSTYDGVQTEINLYVFQDLDTHDWWLVLGCTYVGYWDHRIFTSLTNAGADDVRWGGEVGYPRYQPQSVMPPMGSGHFPTEEGGGGFGKASFISDLILLIKGADDKYQYSKLSEDCCVTASDWEDCYKARDFGDLGGTVGRTIFFGGPPGCAT